MTSVLVVVATRNSARTIGPCLVSIREQTVVPRIVVVDNSSTDGTIAMARALADLVIGGGPERSAQRNLGADAVESDVVGFVDSDMVLSRAVVEQSLLAIDQGAGAVIVPEYTAGDGFWARVRAFERSFYRNSNATEAARFFAKPVFLAIGGFDEGMTGAEDWDVTVRARDVAPIGRTSASIRHDEGRVFYLSACAKKGYYAQGVRKYIRKHGKRAILKGLDRPYLIRPWLLVVPHPLLGLGLIALKSGEVVAMLWSIAWSRPKLI
jgi:glycosyltransferase involved in cell wall biosynthesis